jgi:hypothetical protein
MEFGLTPELGAARHAETIGSAPSPALAGYAIVDKRSGDRCARHKLGPLSKCSLNLFATIRDVVRGDVAHEAASARGDHLRDRAHAIHPKRA